MEESGSRNMSLGVLSAGIASYSGQMRRGVHHDQSGPVQALGQPGGGDEIIHAGRVSAQGARGKPRRDRPFPNRHCEERSDEAIQIEARCGLGWLARGACFATATLAMTVFQSRMITR